MSEQEQVQQNEQTAAPEPTLEDVYKEYNVEGVAQQFQAATAKEAPRPEITDAPDPVTDPDGYRRFQLDQVHRTHDIQQSLQQYGSTVQALVADQQRRQIEADVKNAVDYLKPKFGDAVDADLLETALDNEARRDPRFLKLWESRGTNPTAWKKALDGFSGKYASKFAVRSDPQLMENQRAIRASQEVHTSNRQAPTNDEWGNLSPAEFESKWRSLVND